MPYYLLFQFVCLFATIFTLVIRQIFLHVFKCPSCHRMLIKTSLHQGFEYKCMTAFSDELGTLLKLVETSCEGRKNKKYSHMQT